MGEKEGTRSRLDREGVERRARFQHGALHEVAHQVEPEPVNLRDA